MANTVSILSYANTFGDWMVTTNLLAVQNNNLAANAYTKSTGTLYLNDPSLGLQVANTAIFAGQVQVQGVGSSLYVQNNLTSNGQVLFSNPSLSLTTYGQANIGGPLLVLGANTGLTVANNASIGNKLTSNNIISNYLSVGTSANIPYLSVSNSASIVSLTVTNEVVTQNITANNSINSNLVSANTVQATGSVSTVTVNANTFNVLNGVIGGYHQANSSTTLGTANANILIANSASIASLNVSTNLNANNATVYVNNLQTIGQLSVGGNFVINGTTVYNSNTFTLNSNSAIGQISYFNVNRGSSGANASIRWNESSKYWDILDVVNGANYSQILTANLISTSTNSVSTTTIASSSSVNAVFTYAQSAYASANNVGPQVQPAFNTANSALATANSAYAQANSASSNTVSLQTNLNSANGNIITLQAQVSTLNLISQQAYNTANVGNTFVYTGGTVGGKVVFSGDIVVQGNVYSNSTNTYPSSVGIWGGPLTVPTITLDSTGRVASVANAAIGGATGLPINQGGTGAQSSSSAIQNLLNGLGAGSAGQAVLTNGAGSFYLGSGGGGSSTQVGTLISQTSNVAVASSGQSIFYATPVNGTTPYTPGLSQLKVYINGVRQDINDYTEFSNNAFVLVTPATSGDIVVSDVIGQYTYNNWANATVYTVNSNISPTANTVQLAIDGLTSKLTTYYANTQTNVSLTGITTAITPAFGTSNTMIATTAFVNSVANSGTTQTHNINGNATSANSANNITNSGGWSITPNGNKLYFSFNGTNLASLDSSGNLIVANNVTAYGTP